MFTELCKERALPVIEAVNLLLEEKQRAGEIRTDVPADEIITAVLSMVIYPLADAGICEVMMPSAIVRDEASLERRKRAVVSILLGGLRQSGS